MSEETKTPVGVQNEQSAQSIKSDDNIDYKSLYMNEVENAKKQRSLKQDALSQLNTFKEEQMKEQGKYKELADELSKKVEYLSPFEQKFNEIQTQTKNDLLQKLSDEDKELLADKDIGTIRLFVNKFNSNVAKNPEHIAGRTRNSLPQKAWKDMTDSERRAYYQEKSLQ